MKVDVGSFVFAIGSAVIATLIVNKITATKADPETVEDDTQG